MPRKPRLDAPGVLQHVIARGIERGQIFFDEKDYQFFKDRLGKLILETQMDCFAWVLLPNHFHLLLRTGRTPLPTFMRRLMTAYAGYYNRRHHRAGHLFQNRYKSIICEEDPYFLELVRYIHLNPLRMGLVKNLEELGRYRWCGYGVLMGRQEVLWQKVNEVLEYFGQRVKKARLGHRQFMEEGSLQGRRDDLTGGGLIRSLGGKTVLKKVQMAGEKQQFDDRILGDGQFVDEVLERHRSLNEKRAPKILWVELLENVVKWAGLSPPDLVSGSKRPAVVRGRCVLSYIAVRMMKMKTTTVADYLNVSQPTVSKSLLIGEEIINKNPGMVDQILRKA
jgi:REP element-mobilizing transposase RayT